MMASSPIVPGGQFARLYHSFAMLLPDATVFSGGGHDELPGPDPSYSGEIFLPPYLYYGFRPMIVQTSLDEIVFNTPFDVTVSFTAPHQIDGFVLLRPAAVTHFYDADQRDIELNSIPLADPTTFQVMTPTEDLGPPGYYMLFVIELETSTGRRVPSIANFIKLK